MDSSSSSSRAQSAMDRTESAPDAKLGEEPVAIDADEVAVRVGRSRAEEEEAEKPTLKKSAQELADEQRTWHEQRIRQRLQNEYERAGRALSEMVGENLDTPMRLSSIRVIGANHTRAGFLSRVASPYLVPSTSSSPAVSPTSLTSSLLSLIYPTQPSTSSTSIHEAEQQFPATETLRQVLHKTRSIAEDLAKFGIFESVEAGLDKSRDVLADPYDVDLVLKVKESSRYFLRTATDVGDGEGNATATARIRNAFGGAETLEGNMSFGTRTKSNFAVRLATPLFASPDTTLSISTFATERDLTYFAACRESVRGVKVGLRTLSALGDHEFAYDAILRNMCDVGTGASMSIRNAAGLSVKSALSHTLLRDTRDDPFIATKGSYFRLMQEYAGLGGDADFFKTESETQISRPIGAGCTLSWSLRYGLLYPLGGKPSHFLDRIHLGAPTSVRMFRMNGLGPRDHNDFVGGDLQWSSGLSLITPIPKREDWPIKGHFFLNAGRLVAFNQTLTKSLSDLLCEPAVSAGFGIMYKHSIVRAELNFGMPLAAHKGDGVRKGLQVGLGLHFL